MLVSGNIITEHGLGPGEDEEREREVEIEEEKDSLVTTIVVVTTMPAGR